MPPSFIDERRRAALQVYEREPIPTWRRSGFWTTNLRTLRLEELAPRRYDPVEELPPLAQEALGDGEPAGVLVQRGASTVYAWLDPAAAEQGVELGSLERACEDEPELVEQWYMRRVSHEEGKFAAAAAAFWTGGAFLRVPSGVVLDKPIQVVYVIDEPGTAQYVHTLGIVEENAQCSIREYCLGPDFEGQALHAGLFELFVRPGANVRLAHFQDWGGGEVFDISTKRVEVARDAHCSWIPIHLGGRLTKQTLDIVTAEQGADMRHNGLYLTEGTEHLDLFTTDRHEAGKTTGDTVWKGALTGESRASYEGLIHILPGCQETDTYLQTHSMLLSPRAKGDAIPSLIVQTDNVRASHGGTVGEIDEEQIFYMTSRGIPRQDAVRVLVEGYFEPIIDKLADASLEALVRGRIAEKIAAAEEDVREYVAQL